MVVILCALATIALVALRGRRRPPAHGRRACPHLGLAGDPFVHRDQPAEEHRCYVYLQRDRVDLTHQRSFCLSGAYRRCPWLAIRPSSAEVPLSVRLRTALLGRVASAWHTGRCSGAAASLAALRLIGRSGRLAAVAATDAARRTRDRVGRVARSARFRMSTASAAGLWTMLRASALVRLCRLPALTRHALAAGWPALRRVALAAGRALWSALALVAA
jgi:hypothetical protein